MTWRYYAFRALSGAWVHRELPLSEVKISHTLSGPGGLTASIEPTYKDMVADDGELLFREWDTVIVAEASGQLRGGGVLVDCPIEGDKLSLDCVGFSGYAAGQAISETLKWGGEAGGTTGNGVDPATVIRAIWDHLQGQPDGGLGVTYSSLTTPYRLGDWINSKATATEGGTAPEAGAVAEPVPIDRVWDPKKDKKPDPAKGKTVHWLYQVPYWENVEAGARIDELAKQTPIDYREVWSWADSSREDVVMRLEMGYPRLGKRQSGLRFVEGENITAVVTLQRSGEGYANSVLALGAGEGSKQLRERTTQRDGRLRRTAVVDAGDVLKAAPLKAVAQDELGRIRQLTDITGFTLSASHPNAPVGSFGAGDDVLVQTTLGWQPTSMWVRITGYEYSPDEDTISVTCSRSDGFDYSGGSSTDG